MLKNLDRNENYKDLIPNGALKISPSMIAKFFDRKWEWFANEVKGEVTFLGNTSTFLGTIVHRIAEEFIKTRNVNKQALLDYIASIDELVADKDFILAQYKPMGEALINHLISNGIPNESEKVLATKISANTYLAGTIDAILGDTIIDFKTTSKTTPDVTIPMHYKYQLLSYAYLARANGIDISRLSIIWITNNITGRVSEKTGKPLKDYPARCEQIYYVITPEDMEFIDSCIKLIAETYEYYLKHKELAYILYSDYRLKEFI